MTAASPGSTILLLALLGLWPAGLAIAQGPDREPTYDRLNIEGEDYGYVLRSAVWTFPRGEEQTIFVCWENAEQRFAEQMRWVREAVEGTWQKHSALSFRGWGPCAPRNAGIRIRIADEGPHVKRLGRHIDAMPGGMVLNFTYESWGGEVCRKSREYCIRAIAVHEFGHAIGFAHEQNRFDAPGECQLRKQGTSGDVLLTPYDAGSVMNYCNKRYNNDGQLSPIDVVSVQRVYCRPDDSGCTPRF